MRVLSDGRERSGWWLAAFVIGASWLACIGAFVVARALVEWLT